MKQKTNIFSIAVSGAADVLRDLGGFFRTFGTAFARGDWAVKLTLLWWGAGYARRKQYVKALLMLFKQRS